MTCHLALCHLNLACTCRPSANLTLKRDVQVQVRMQGFPRVTVTKVGVKEYAGVAARRATRSDLLITALLLLTCHIRRTEESVTVELTCIRKYSEK